MTRSDGTLGTLPRLVVLVVVALGFVASVGEPITLVTFTVYALVGALLVIRQPRNRVSWLLLLLAFLFIGTTGTPAVDLEAIVAGRASPAEVAIALVFSWSGYGVFLAFAALAALFPSGHLPDGRWRPVIVTALAVGVVVTVLSMLTPTFEVSLDGVNAVHVPNPLAVAPDLPIWPVMPSVGLATAIVLFALGVASLLARYRTATEVVRLQVRWLLAAIAAVLVGVVLGVTLSLLVGDDLGGLIWLPALVAFPTVPLAIGFAITRYRLYEIDRIVNRAVVYAGVTAILAGVFAALTAVTQRVFIAITGEASDVGIVLTTLVVATLYSPVRKRVETAVDRVLKYDQRRFGAYRDQLQRLLDLVDPAAAAARLAREILAETGATGVAVIDRDGDLLGTAGTWPVEGTIMVPVPGASPFGTVVVGPRSDDREVTSLLPAIGDIAELAGRALDDRTGRRPRTAVVPETLPAVPVPTQAAVEATDGPAVAQPLPQDA